MNEKRISLRLPDWLHSRLVTISRKNRRSLNNEIIYGLEEYASREKTLAMRDLMSEAGNLIEEKRRRDQSSQEKQEG